MEIDSSSRHISAKPDAKHQTASSFSMACGTLLFVGFIFDGVAGAAADSRLQSSNASHILSAFAIRCDAFQTA
jgi:hypothetical protein